MSELGLFENTLLILLSDHGVGFGEHGVTGKPPYALWPEVTDIAYLIRQPGGNGAGRTSEFFASTHDVAPTVLGHLGIEPDQPMDGTDLSVLFDDEEPEERAHFTAGYHDFVLTRDEEYAMISRHDGENASLYDLVRDPEMTRDIATANLDVVRRMYGDYVLGDAGGSLPDYES
jgi:arylsulfatase A-like enzyme